MTTSDAVPSHVRRDSSTGGLFRSPAVRNRSAKGIRERRSESRSGKGKDVEDGVTDDRDHDIAPWDRGVENEAMVKPTDLVLPSKSSHVASVYP